MLALRTSTVTVLVSTMLAAAVLAIAGSHHAQADSRAARAAHAETGVRLVISHQVYDFDRWQRAHERTAAVKRAQYGWQRSELFAVDGDRNHVMVIEHFASRERAAAFASSQELTYEMAASGVSSEPHIQVVSAIER